MRCNCKDDGDVKRSLHAKIHKLRSSHISIASSCQRKMYLGRWRSGVHRPPQLHILKWVGGGGGGRAGEADAASDADGRACGRLMRGLDRRKQRCSDVSFTTGCPTVSVSTLIAYFSAIIDYYEISFQPCNQQGSGIFLRYVTSWYMQRCLRK